jgi:hypothetical protein
MRQQQPNWVSMRQAEKKNTGNGEKYQNIYTNKSSNVIQGRI